MPFDKSQRLRVPEQMDADDVDPDELGKALAFIRRINAWLGYNRVVADAVLRELGPREGSSSVLDVATGSGDLLIDLAARAGRPLDLIGIDRHAATLDEGVRVSGSTVRFVRGDALSLPFDDASVDVVTSTLFLHHLSDDEARAALNEMARVARRAVVVADLIRSRRAYFWITAFTLGSTAMVRHDARASVAHAFTLGEMHRLAHDATMADARVTRTFGHRSMLVWRRPGN